MFSNLIESSSHKKEFKRRGSFLLFTTATYVVLFVITGVISIYAYDARLEKQSLELVILLPPTEIVPDKPAAPVEKPKVTRETNESNITEVAEAMVSVNRPEIPPPDVGTKAPTNPPIPDHGDWIVTGRNRPAAGLPAGPGTPSGGSGQLVPSRELVKMDEPPPAPEPPKAPRVISKGPITGQATSLPQPPY